MKYGELVCLTEGLPLELADMFPEPSKPHPLFTPAGIRRPDCNSHNQFRDQVYTRDRNQCVYCGSTENLSLDHLIPVCQGGVDALYNLVTACLPCNRSKGGRRPEEWRQLTL